MSQPEDAIQVPVCNCCGGRLLKVVQKTVTARLYLLKPLMLETAVYRYDKPMDKESYTVVVCYHCRAVVNDILDQAGIECP